MELSQAFLISLAVATGGRLVRALTNGGAVMATLVGSAILWRTGWPGLAALGAFFVGASVISMLAPDHAARHLDAKGTQRDSVQVLANGGAAALAALVVSQPVALAVVTASLAAAAADTWATSTGAWSRRWPRFILNGSPVPPGTSGGITLHGTAGAVGGATLVGVSAGLIAGDLLLVPLSIVIGVAGMLLDSLLGATLQARFHCPACDQPTERARHRCGTETHRVGGVAWISNDVVNAMATTAAALLGWAAGS